MPELIETDVLILGSGVAGATAALGLADQGVHGCRRHAGPRSPQESNTLLRPGRHHLQGPGRHARGPGRGHPARRRRPQLPARGPPAGGGRSACGRGRPDRPCRRAVRPRCRRRAVASRAKAATRCRASCTWRTTRARRSRCAWRGRWPSIPNITLLTGHTAVDLLTPSHHALEPALRLRAAVVRGRVPVSTRKPGRVKRVLRRQDGARHGRPGTNLPSHLQPGRLAWRRRGDGLERRRADHQPGVHPVSPDDLSHGRRAELPDLRGGARGGRASWSTRPASPSCTATRPSGRTLRPATSSRAASTGRCCRGV